LCLLLSLWLLLTAGLLALVAPAQKHNPVRPDLGSVTVVALLVLPLAGLQTTLDQSGPALG
jgi:NADH:ubiquinone oxidoreductase subunit K